MSGPLLTAHLHTPRHSLDIFSKPSDAPKKSLQLISSVLSGDETLKRGYRFYLHLICIFSSVKRATLFKKSNIFADQSGFCISFCEKAVLKKYKSVSLKNARENCFTRIEKAKILRHKSLTNYIWIPLRVGGMHICAKI